MTLTNVSPWGFWMGCAALALMLAVLQWLRTRHRTVHVVTTLFWQEAMEESRARVFWRRFRHPWAYLLALLIAGLTWLAWADPRPEREGAVETVILIDGSAAMMVGDRLAQVREQVMRELRRLPAEHRRVFWVGGQTTLLLDRGEEALLLEARWKGRQAEVAPSGIEQACLALSSEAEARPLQLVVAGNGSLGDDVLTLLPEDVKVLRLVNEEEEAKPSNTGVRALGMAATLGNPETVDVWFEVDAPMSEVQVKVDAKPWTGALNERQPGRVWCEAVPARGGRLEVRLSNGGALSADDVAAIQLPWRQRIRVSVSEDTPLPLRRVLEADDAVEMVDAEADVTVGFTTSDGIPSLVWDETGEAFVFVSEEAQAPESLHALMGLDQIDTVGLAEQSGRVVRLQVETGPTRRAQLWPQLLSQEYHFIQSSAFPLYVGQTLRWLAKVPKVDPYVAAGETHPRLKAAGVPFALPRAGDYEDGLGQLRVAHLSGDPLSSDKGSEPRVTTLSGAIKGGSWATWLILVVLVLLLGEWVLFQNGRMP